jgi:acyl carrier protein
MEIQEIYKKTQSVIEESVGIPADSIGLDDTLFDGLEIDSIDLVDILFELENTYDIELKISDIEERAKAELGDQPYEIEGVITPEGLKAIKSNMVEIDISKVKEGLTVHQLVRLFTVHSICKIVKYKLDAKSE